jgi:hypothetical protein
MAGRGAARRHLACAKRTKKIKRCQKTAGDRQEGGRTDRKNRRPADRAGKETDRQGRQLCSEYIGMRKEESRKVGNGRLIYLP